MKYSCSSRKEPIIDLCNEFNEETDNGRKMNEYNELLGKAIESIINVKNESDIDAFLQGDQVDFVKGKAKGLDDFELICFVIVK